LTGQPGHRILIVDDDAGIRRSLQALLRKAGYDVMLAATQRGGPAPAGGTHHRDVRRGPNEAPGSVGNAALLGSVQTIEKPFTLAEMMSVVSRALRDVR
jgi:DNA-binding NtrC family response regulator